MLTGNGADMNLPTPPDEIPGYVASVKPFVNTGNFGGLGMESLGHGNIRLNFARSGQAKLEVYSLSGKNMGTLLNAYQNAGLSNLSLGALNLQKGVYILRLRQGSQIKTVRVVY